MVITAATNLAAAMPGIQGFMPLPSEIGNEFMTLQTSNMALTFGFYYNLAGRLSGSLTNEEVEQMKKNPNEVLEFLKPYFDENYKFFKKQAETHWLEIQTHILDKAHELEILKVQYNIQLLKDVVPAYLEEIKKLSDESIPTIGNASGSDIIASIFGPIGNLLNTVSESITPGTASAVTPTTPTVNPIFSEEPQGPPTIENQLDEALEEEKTVTIVFEAPNLATGTPQTYNLPNTESGHEQAIVSKWNEVNRFLESSNSTLKKFIPWYTTWISLYQKEFHAHYGRFVALPGPTA
jgi:hypothetical protein